MTHHLALVTGASSGIGEALCQRLDQQGIPLILSGRNAERLKALAEQLKLPAEILVADLSTDEGIQQHIQIIKERKPDLVVNNAGLGFYGAATDLSDADQTHLLKVNCEALMRLTIAAGQTLKQAKMPGTILNVSSVAAFQPFPWFAAYAASKSFVNVFSESLYYELKPHNIQVLAACPGQINTRFRNRAAKSQDSGKVPSYVMTADYAADVLWNQIQSGKRIHIFDWRYQLSAFLTRYLLPTQLVVNRLKHAIQKRT